MPTATSPVAFAPIPAICGAAIEPLESTLSHRSRPRHLDGWADQEAAIGVEGVTGRARRPV